MVAPAHPPAPGKWRQEDGEFTDSDPNEMAVDELTTECKIVITKYSSVFK